MKTFDMRVDTAQKITPWCWIPPWQRISQRPKEAKDFSQSKAEPENVENTLQRAIPNNEREMAKNPENRHAEREHHDASRWEVHRSNCEGNHKADEIQCQTRQHSKLINPLEANQICVNKIDCDTANNKQNKCDEMLNEMISMLIKIAGKDFIEENTHKPFKWHRMLTTVTLNSASSRGGV